MTKRKAPPVRNDDPKMHGERARTLEGDLRAKRGDTFVGTIEGLYGVDFGVRSDMKLQTLRERLGAHGIKDLIRKAEGG